MVSIRTFIQSLFTASLFASMALITGCGGGGAADPFAVVPPVIIPPLVVSPNTLTVTQGTPATLTVTSGVAPYQVFTSNTLLLPVAQAVSGNTITLAPVNVSVETIVTITVRDSAAQTATVTVTVRPAAVAPTPALIVTPAVLTIYSGTPVRITINSGVGPFQVFTSDAVVLPVTQAVAGAGIDLTASTVSVDNVVTLTVRDAAGQSATVTVTVKPSPVLGALSITQTSNSTCAGTSSNTVDRAAICSGESGVASITVRSANTSVLPNRQIRFDVVQGSFDFLIGQSAATTAKTLTVVTDQNGKADVAFRTIAGTPSQAALIRATDLTSGNRVDGAFTIVQATNGAAILSVVPATYSGSGGFVSQCLSVSGDYVIYGGTAPYTITNGLPNAGTLSSGASAGQVITVAVQGGIFRFTSNAVAEGCGGFKAPITIADASGRITTVEFNVTAGTTVRVPAVFSPTAVSFTANQGGTAAVAAIAPIAAACSDGSTPVGTSCGFTVYTPANCANGVVNAANTGCQPVSYVPARCVYPDGSAGVVNPTITGCQPPPVTVPVTPPANYTPPSCTNGTLNSSFTGCVTPVVFTAATCTNGTVVYSTIAFVCAQATYSGGFAGSPAIPATPNTQCTARSVVYTINGGVVPYVLSSSLSTVVPATAVIGASPANVTIFFPVLDIGIVTLTAVDARGALFTATAACVAGT